MEISTQCLAGVLEAKVLDADDINGVSSLGHATLDAAGGHCALASDAHDLGLP